VDATADPQTNGGKRGAERDKHIGQGKIVRDSVGFGSGVQRAEGKASHLGKKKKNGGHCTSGFNNRPATIKVTPQQQKT